MTPAGSPRGRPAKRLGSLRSATFSALVCLVLGAGFAVWVKHPNPTAESAPPSASPVVAFPSSTIALGASNGYLVTRDELAKRAEMARDGLEPYATAVTHLLQEADQALRRDPRPQDPLKNDSDEFLADTQDAYTLALAWSVTEDERYARKAAGFIMAWVEGVEDTRHTCTAAGGRECATSLLVSRCAPAFVFAARLLDGSGAVSDEEKSRLRSWMAKLILPAASERANNWGDAGAFMRLTVADYVEDQGAFLAAVDQWRAMMDLVTADGQIPEETRRGSLGLLYTQGAISYKVAAATIAGRRGIDLWGYRGRNGGTLREAIDYLVRYWEDPEDWPWYHREQVIPSVDPAWELIFQRWPHPAYARILGPRRPFGATNPSAIIWTTLTNGQPLEDPGTSTLWRPQRMNDPAHIVGSGRL